MSTRHHQRRSGINFILTVVVTFVALAGLSTVDRSLAWAVSGVLFFGGIALAWALSRRK